MTFKEFLQANGLPPIGTTLVTPDGTKVILIRYEFWDNEEYAVIDCGCPTDIYWTFNQVSKCTWQEKDKENIV